MGVDVLGMRANAGFMVAAYVVTGLILVGYAAALWRMARKGKRK